MTVITILPSAIHANNGTVLVKAAAGEGITLTVTQDGQSITLDFGTIVAKLLADRLKDAAKEWKSICPNN